MIIASPPLSGLGRRPLPPPAAAARCCRPRRCARVEASRHGGLQAAVVAAAAEDADVRRYAAVALENLTAGSPEAQKAVVTHGGLRPLLALAASPADLHASRAAAKALLNLASNQGLVPGLMRQVAAAAATAAALL